MPSPVRRARPLTLFSTGVAVLIALALGLQLNSAATSGATTAGKVAPGDFTGMGFDACAAPSSTTMDKWMKARENPYRAVGVYISGALRACSQPNLTAGWVSHVISTGWHVLPLTVGPQASCSGFSKRVSSDPDNTYAKARAQGAAEAKTAVATATKLGIAPRSTLFYDMESWHTGYTRCDASTLWFLSSWSKQLHRMGYAGGVYSSASTGVRLMDDIASAPPAGFVVPDHIWFAQWNDKENTASNYIAAANWARHARVHQFYGGHNARNGGVTINIDSNWIDLRTPVLGRTPTPPPSPTAAPSPTSIPTPTASPTTPPTTAPTTAPVRATLPTLRCDRARITRISYPSTSSKGSPELIAAAQCLLRKQGVYKASVTGAWNAATVTAVKAFQHKRGLPQKAAVTRRTWTALLSAGHSHKLRIGTSKPRSGMLALARSLNAANGAGLHSTGYFGPLTRRAVIRYQRHVFGHGNGVVTKATWNALHHGRTQPLPHRSARLVAAPAAPTPAPTPAPTARPTPAPSAGASGLPDQHAVAPGAHDPALAQAPSSKRAGTTHSIGHSIGVKAPTRHAAPALPKAQRVRVPQMVPSRAGTTAPVRVPVFSTALQSQMWQIISELDSHTRILFNALAPWLDQGAGDGS